MTAEFILLLVMVLASAFFSGLEIALFSLGRAHVRSMVEHEVPGAEVIQRLKEKPDRLLVVILIGNNVANIGAASLATAVSLRLFGDVGVGIATGVMTLLILIFGEIIPKSLSVRWAEKIALFAANILRGFSFIVFPAAWILEKMSIGLTKLLGGKKSSLIKHGTIVTTLSRLGLEEGKIEELQHRLVESAFRLNETPAERVMTPRSNMISLQSETKISEALDMLKGQPYSRYPVFKIEREGIIGIIHMRDLFDNFYQDRGDTPIEKITSKPLFIACTMPLSDLLILFQRERTHMAIVLDEYGDTDGVVTLEDVLEELVGEIEDENDATSREIIQIHDGHYLLYASVTIDDLNRELDLDLPLDEHNTINGLLLDAFQRIPKPLDQVTLEGYKFIVRQTNPRRIILVELQIPEEELPRDL